jgi:hypothetical protein
MDEKLNEIIKKAQKDLDARRRADKERVATIEALTEKNNNKIRELARALFPDEVRPYISFAEGFGWEAFITIPGLAIISHKLYVRTQSVFNKDLDAWIQSVNEVTLGKGEYYQLPRWGAFEGEINTFPIGNTGKIETLDMALALAAELGDGKQEAEEEALRQRDAMLDKPVVGEILHPKQCPQMFTLNEYADCVTEGCAWWDNTTGECAVLTSGRAAYLALPDGSV